MNRVLVLAALSFAVALPASAQIETTQSANFATAIAGNVAPLTVRFGDLDTSWRRVTPTATDNSTLFQIIRSRPYRGSFSMPDYLYTQGKTVSIGGEQFVIAYRLVPAETTTVSVLPEGNYSAPLQAPSIPVALSGETKLQLSLLNPRITGRFDNIQAVDVAKDIAQSQKARNAVVNQISLAQLTQIGAIFVYFARSSGKLPPLGSADSLQKTLQTRYGYVSSAWFLEPGTKKPYRTDAALSGTPLKSLQDTTKTIVLYENTVSTDGTRAVLFVNGTAQRLKEAEFSRLLKSSTAIAPKSKTVKLYGAAALYFLYRMRNQNDGVQMYMSASNKRIYYRDAKTHQAIYVAPPVKPIEVPIAQAQDYKDYAGYNGQKSGQTFGGFGYPAN